MFRLCIQILLFFLIQSFRLFGQTSINIGPEIGVSLTANQDRYYLSAGTWDKSKEITSPIIGIVCDLRFSNHFKISTGIKYERVGIKEKFNGNTFVNDIETIYNKLCFPAKVSVILRGAYIKPSINIGYIQNYILSGDRGGMDLFETDIKPKRLTGQFSIGFSLCIKKIEITSSYVIGNIIEWGWNNHLTSPGGAHYTRITTYPLKNNEYCFTVVFFPFEIQKKREPVSQLY